MARHPQGGFARRQARVPAGLVAGARRRDGRRGLLVLRRVRQDAHAEVAGFHHRRRQLRRCQPGQAVRHAGPCLRHAARHQQGRPPLRLPRYGRVLGTQLVRVPHRSHAARPLDIAEPTVRATAGASGRNQAPRLDAERRGSGAKRACSFGSPPQEPVLCRMSRRLGSVGFGARKLRCHRQIPRRLQDRADRRQHRDH